MVSRIAAKNILPLKPPTTSTTAARYASSSRSTRRMVGDMQRQHQPKRWLSSGPPSASPKPESKKDSPTIPNLALASVLFGFVTWVFLYSMNAVGRGDGEDDPLAQLKAEAKEAREAATAEHRKKLTPEEIQALESGMTGDSGDGGLDRRVVVEVAVAAPEDIAALEEEANLRVFQQKQQNASMRSADGTQDQPPTKKKSWWRFGF
jgi:hypothetical protein